MAWEYLKVFHLLFMMAFFAGTIVSTMAGIRARKAQEIETVATLTRMSSSAGLFLTTPAFMLTGLFGVLTAQQQNLALMDTAWLNAAYGATVIVFVLGVGVMVRRDVRAARLAARDQIMGSRSPELDAALSERLPMLVGPVLHALVAYLVVMMVFQPT